MTAEIIVGRQEQIVELRSHCQTAFEQKQGRVVFLTGEAGIGKTALGRHVSGIMRGHTRGLQCAYAECNQVTGDTAPYAPFVTLHARLFEQAEPQDEPWLVPYLKHVGLDFFDLVPVVGDYFKIAFKSVYFAWEQVRSRRIAPTKAVWSNQTEVFQKFTTSLRLIAAQKPLLLFMDDWQWADASSTHLLLHLARHLNDVPILVLVAYAPHDAEARGHPILNVRRQMEQRHLCAGIDLTFLTERHVADYFRRRFKAHPDVALVEQLMALTEGNAFFLVEYLNLLADQGALTADGALTVPVAQLPVPLSLQAMVRDRLSYLQDPDRTALDYASVEANANSTGQEFTSLFLKHVLKTDTLSLVPRLDKLYKLYRLVVELGYQPFYPGKDDTTVYRFAHALFHRTLYHDLPKEIRVEVNRLLLDFKRDIYQTAGEAAQRQLAPQLMIHAAEARDYQAQAAYALEASGKATAGHAHDEALKQHGLGLRALDALTALTLESQALRIDLLLSHGETYEIIGQWDRALETHTRAKALAEALKDPARLGKAHRHIGNVYFRQGDYDQALPWFKGATELFEKVNDQASLATTYNNIGAILDIRGQYDQALDWYQKSVAIARDLGDQTTLAYTYNNMAGICHIRGEYDQALDWHRQSLVFSEELRDREGIARSYHNLGLVHQAREEYGQALDWHHKALAVEQELGDQAGLADVYHDIAVIHYARGEYDQARDWSHKALVIKEKLGVQPDSAAALYDIVKAAIAQDKPRSARELFRPGSTRRSRDISTKLGPPRGGPGGSAPSR